MCVYINIYIYIYVCACVYEQRMHMYMYMHTCTYVYIYMYIHIFIYTYIAGGRQPHRPCGGPIAAEPAGSPGVNFGDWGGLGFHHLPGPSAADHVDLAEEERGTRDLLCEPVNDNLVDPVADQAPELAPQPTPY